MSECEWNAFYFFIFFSLEIQQKSTAERLVKCWLDINLHKHTINIQSSQQTVPYDPSVAYSHILIKFWHDIAFTERHVQYNTFIKETHIRFDYLTYGRWLCSCVCVCASARTQFIKRIAFKHLNMHALAQMNMIFIVGGWFLLIEGLVFIWFEREEISTSNDTPLEV